MADSAPDSNKIQQIIADLQKTRPPLARLVEAMALSNTTRDKPDAIALDIGLMMASRDARSPIKAALDYYENTEIKNQAKDRVLRALKGEE